MSNGHKYLVKFPLAFCPMPDLKYDLDGWNNEPCILYSDVTFEF